MKIGTNNKNEIIDKVIRTLNNGTYPFNAVRDGDSIIVKWEWKDATQFGIGTVSREVSAFRYVVMVNDDNTFYGYDTDESRIASLGVSGANCPQDRSFIGHEIRFHRETAVGRNAGENNTGVRTWEFSTTKVHNVVKEVFENNGWKYKEPAVTWITLHGSHKSTYKMLGILFLVVGILGTILFVSLNLLPANIVTMPITLIGLWAVLVGTGKKKFPVLSMKTTVILTLSGFFGSWILVLLGLMIFL